MPWVFLGENFKPVVFDQSCRVLMAACKCSLMDRIFFPLHVIVKSSANSRAFICGLKLIVMSLIPIKNSVMLITEPCGTPFLIKTWCDSASFALIWNDLLDRKLVINNSILPFTFNSREGINNFGSLGKELIILDL